MRLLKKGRNERKALRVNVIREEEFVLPTSKSEVSRLTRVDDAQEFFDTLLDAEAFLPCFGVRGYSFE